MRTDMYFSEHKFVVEIDEKGHIDRNENKKKMKDKRKQKKILIVNFSTGLILIQRALIFFLKLVKYKITSLNQMKKNGKANLQNTY